MAFNDMLEGMLELKSEPIAKERYHGHEAELEVKNRDVLYNPDELVSVNRDETMPKVFKLPAFDTSQAYEFGEETAAKINIVKGMIRTKLKDLATQYRIADNRTKSRLVTEAYKLNTLYFSLEDSRYDEVTMHAYRFDEIISADEMVRKTRTRLVRKDRSIKQKKYENKRTSQQSELYKNMGKAMHEGPKEMNQEYVENLEKKADEQGISYDEMKEMDLKERSKQLFDHEIHTEFINSDFMREKLKKEKVEIKDSNGKKKTVKQIDLLKMVLRNDFSNIEKLDPAARNILAAIYMQRVFVKEVGPERDEAKIVEKVRGMESHPLLRIGISLAAQGRLGVAVSSLGDKKWFAKIDELLNTRIMEKTITAKPSATQGIDNEDIRKNAQSQLFIAKTMLVCHMGKFTITESKEKAPWTQTIANAFSHCSRVGIILPGVDGENLVEEQDRMIDSYTGAGQGLLAGFHKRASATHALNKKSKTKDNFKEKKWYGYNPWGQFGMDVAVGGLGNDGITGAGGRARKFKRDGTSGHIYMKLLKGDKNTHTGMLIGFESDSYKKTNQLGHTHGWGNGEFQSSFGGQRVDEVGDKYGGRTADLSKVTKEDFEIVMNQLDAVFRANQQAGAEGAARNEAIVKLLCGNYMTGSAYLSFLKNNLGLDDEVARRIAGARPA